jgi:uncharacterized protein YhfF
MMTHGHRIPAMVVDAPLPRLDPAVLELGAPGDMRARLVQAVLTGAKTATTCLQVLHDLVGQPPPVPGQRATVAAWRRSTWTSRSRGRRAGLGDPSWALSDDTVVVVERFRLLGPG